MPFEPAPKSEPTFKLELVFGPMLCERRDWWKRGEFKPLAEALLRGCAQTRPAVGELYKESVWPWMKPRACAMGALLVGLGCDLDDHARAPQAVTRMWVAYFYRYMRTPESDNDSEALTREQIAERIAAL